MSRAWGGCALLIFFHLLYLVLVHSIANTNAISSFSSESSEIALDHANNADLENTSDNHMDDTSAKFVGPRNTHGSSRPIFRLIHVGDRGGLRMQHGRRLQMQELRGGVQAPGDGGMGKPCGSFEVKQCPAKATGSASQQES